MRLIGFRFDEADGPVSEGFLPLGQLTGILGASDAGKSRLLRMLASALTSPPTVRARFYAELAPEEISRMLRTARWKQWVQDHRPVDLTARHYLPRCWPRFA
jgi:ABC-type transport system involved in cytochrome bd biosynthesis fused ATPase/permease subunit